MHLETDGTATLPALRLPDRRQAMYAALMAARDDGIPVRAARAMVARHFRASEAEVAEAERRGSDEGWLD